MKFGQRLGQRRKELGLTRAELAEALAITPSAVSNYEKSLSFPREEILLRLFDSLQTDPNTLFQDSFRGGGEVLTSGERKLLESYRELSPPGREALRNLAASLRDWQRDWSASRLRPEPRQIPLYRSPAAAGYTAPVFGEDFDYIPVKDPVPPGAEYAVRIQGDSMSPWIPDGSVVYVNRDPLRPGDVGIFCVDGEMFCKQYYQDGAGMIYLFSLNRQRAGADILLSPSGGRTFICMGRVILLHSPPLPGK